MKYYFIIAMSLLTCIQPSIASEAEQLIALKKAYPTFIKNINNESITWKDGKKIYFRNTFPFLLQQLHQPLYISNQTISCKTYIPKNDPGRIRDEKFFGKMYGHTEKEVARNLVIIYWMPHYFHHQYPLLITKVNQVNIKLKRISDQLELLVKKHPEFIQYLDKPSGTFYWRYIQNSHRRSPHSFGIAIDINSQKANYWIWDTGIKSNSLNQIDNFPYKNHIPCEIVTLFENNQFIWGGKWQHYDTMHFEYRPELLIKKGTIKSAYGNRTQ